MASPGPPPLPEEAIRAAALQRERLAREQQVEAEGLVEEVAPVVSLPPTEIAEEPVSAMRNEAFLVSDDVDVVDDLNEGIEDDSQDSISSIESDQEEESPAAKSFRRAPKPLPNSFLPPTV